jgi:Fibronectin type III domain
MMRKSLIFKRQRFTACLFYGFYIFLIVLFSGCGGESDDSLSPGLSETGSATFNVAWHEAPVIQASGNILRPAAEPEPVDCERIDDIICEVYDGSNTWLTSKTFDDCSAGHGKIDNIPVGTNRKFVVLGVVYGEDDEEQILYHGEASGVTITAGQTTDAGTIDSYYFVPTDLKVEDVSSSAISLSWNASASNVVDAGFNVYRDRELLESVSLTSYSDTGLIPSTEYCYTVSAYDAAGNGAAAYESLPSNEVCQTTGPDIDPPSTPANLLAEAVSPSQINLSWKASVDNVGVTGYYVNLWDGEVTYEITTTSHSFTGLYPSIEYCYTVSAYDAAGNESEPSSEECAETPPEPVNPPPTPNPMTWATEPYAMSTSSISMVATTASDPDTPITYRFNFVDSPTEGSGGTDSAWQSSTSYIDSGLEPNQQYGYQVQAKDSQNNTTGYSSTLYAYTLANIPGYPSEGPFLIVTENSIRVDWTANGNPSGTEYFCENMDNGTNSGWTTNTYWDSTGLTCGTSYEFRVMARNGDGEETSWRFLDDTYTQGCSDISIMVGDNDGYGYDVPDNSDLPPSDDQFCYKTLDSSYPYCDDYDTKDECISDDNCRWITWIFDNREPSELSGPSMHTDHEPGEVRDFTFEINFTPVDTSASIHSVFTIDISGTEASWYGDSSIYLDDYDYSHYIPQELGPFGSQKVDIPILDSSLFTDGSLTVHFQGGSTDAIAIDFFSLEITYDY